MKKPKAKKIERLDYHECADYIEKKLGYDLRDTLGKYNEKNTKDGSYEKIEYRDFWHFLVEACDIQNGSDICIPDLDVALYDWQKEIIEAFHREFGHNAIYWVEW